MHFRGTSGFRYLLGCLAATLFAALPAHARVDKPHPPVDPHHIVAALQDGPADLSSAWLTHNGDDPRYADPRFDDSQWPTIKVGGRRFSITQVNGPKGAWFRTHVHVPPGSRNLALLLRWFPGNWTLFVNGVPIGSSGIPPPQGPIQSSNETSIRRFAIPDSLVTDGNLTIAVRQSDLVPGAGIADSRAELLLGSASVLDEYASLFRFRSLTPTAANLALELLIMLIALALALTLREEREYFALAIFFAITLAVASLGIWTNTANIRGSFGLFGKVSLEFLGLVALNEFVRLVLGITRSRLFLIVEWMLVIGAAASLFLPLAALIQEPKLLSVIIASTLGILMAAGGLAFLLGGSGLPFISLWLGWKRHNRDAMLLSIPLLLQPLEILTTAVTRFLADRHGQFIQPPIKGMYVEWKDAGELLLNLAMLLFLVVRTVRIARARAMIATEIMAVQQVQQLLLARASEPTPGFNVESVYLPAGEVGGDFFLVESGHDGSLTAIVGDVSGKGLVAAMRVSMILGVLRREDSRDPAIILSGLNSALLTQEEIGFTTACCVRLEHSGHFTIANAGHISPYMAGAELMTLPSLPLGLAPDQTYDIVSGQLLAGERLVLMSDGVVEARAASGELYGFERLCKLTLMPAADIADIAKRFGQEDDITVLTIACGGAGPCL
jgi:sigma-B regulation protein RsbU (phosphoserine phosphatase)